tara:strand:+ start:49518 stop:49820 length:303 start_codon:yes stop_codon:yes gene_type:complete
MNLFKKISNVFKQKKTHQDLPLHIQISDSVERIIQKRQLDLGNKPNELSKEEWNNILVKIRYAFQSRKDMLPFKSKAKRIRRQTKIDQGFDLLKKYYKQL